MKSKCQEFHNKMETGKCYPGPVMTRKDIAELQDPKPWSRYYLLKAHISFFEPRGPPGNCVLG